MSAAAASKRLAKRSILGTRVVAPGEDGKLYPGIIQAMKTCEDRLGESRYSVKFDDTRKVKEFRQSEVIGPGFQSVTSSKLRSGQNVFVTHCNREMQGSVVHHRPNIDQVIIQLLNDGPEVKKKLEEVRLLESRKSARLIGHGSNTDFSKLADFNIVHERKRLNSETNSDISGASGRKRRGSETLSESSGDEYHSGMWGSCCDERSSTPVMSECTAAMVLMNLSFSPRWLQMAQGSPANHSSPAMECSSKTVQPTGGDSANENRDSRMTTPCSSPVNMTMAAVSAASSAPLTNFSDLASVAANVMIDGSVSPSSSGISSLGSSWTSMPNLTEAEALLQLSNQESDEGIVSDQSSSADPNDDANKRLKTERIIFRCTWPKCSTSSDARSGIERHIRQDHLRTPDPISEEDHDHMEDFYYSETEVPCTPLGPPVPFRLSPTLASSHHPPHFSTNGTNHLPPLRHATTHHRTIVPNQASGFHPNLPPSLATATPVLADHMDMARPPHENPEYNVQQQNRRIQGLVPGGPPLAMHHSNVSQTQGLPIAISMPAALNLVSAPSGSPILGPPTHNSALVNGVSNAKLPRLSPKPSGVQKSPIRRPRGDTKKCRKVYGMDRRDMWCTQCKWKKACTRFGESST